MYIFAGYEHNCATFDDDSFYSKARFIKSIFLIECSLFFFFHYCRSIEQLLQRYINVITFVQSKIYTFHSKQTQSHVFFFFPSHFILRDTKTYTPPSNRTFIAMKKPFSRYYIYTHEKVGGVIQQERQRKRHITHSRILPLSCARLESCYLSTLYVYIYM